MTVHPDDPRLTAYLMDELGQSERKELEQELEACPESRTLLEDLRGTADLLRQELCEEQAPGLNQDQQRKIEQGMKERPEPAGGAEA